MKKAIVLLLIIDIVSSTNRFDHVREYLNRPETIDSRKLNTKEYFPNSNLIAHGYNPIQGTPICFSGSCDSVISKSPIFQLYYTQNPIGDCTSNTIPEHVDLFCVPSSNFESRTETISTLERVWESTSNGISFGPGIKYLPLTASYKYSKETRFMIDRTIKQDTTSMVTRGRVTYARLSMFEPFMTLSDKFNYVIKEMPCCEYNETIQDYVEEFIIDYFGLTYINELTLGGLAQRTIFIQNKQITLMQESGVDVTHGAEIGYLIQFGGQVSSSQLQGYQDSFNKSIKESYYFKLGGDQSLTNTDEWIRSIPSNPAIMNVVVKDIVGLLTTKRFPHDSSIQRKSELVNMAIQSYTNNIRPFCFNNCTDSNHGTCNVSNSHLQLGTCTCLPGWKGIDCSKSTERFVIAPSSGPWGSYRNWVYCPDDTWAIGFSQRVDEYHGLSDDSAVNALELVCGDAQSNRVASIISYEGLWGAWGSRVYCNGPKNYLRTAQFRVEDSSSIDVTGVTDSYFKCTDDSGIQASNGHSWGYWYSSASCPPSTAICGFQLLFQSYQGSTGDDTAMNGAQFACCYTY